MATATKIQLVEFNNDECWCEDCGKHTKLKEV